ncbi:MAG TPA: hypothetical protein VKV77_01230 [Methylovirgula sp.]|nr:hypothetical protein [Methylovirgula sp.]
MHRELRSRAELREICLQALRSCEGFEQVDEILIQPRVTAAGGSNWTLAGFRPRVGNAALRGARGAIDQLRRSYELSAEPERPRDKPNS